MAGVPAERPRCAELDWESPTGDASIGYRNGYEMARVQRYRRVGVVDENDYWSVTTIADEQLSIGGCESEAAAQCEAEEQVAEWFERIDVGDLRADRA